MSLVDLCAVCGQDRNATFLVKPTSGYEYCARCWGPIVINTRWIPIPSCVLFPDWETQDG